MPASPTARAYVTCHISVMRMMPLNTGGMIQVGHAEKGKDEECRIACCQRNMTSRETDACRNDDPYHHVR